MKTETEQKTRQTIIYLIMILIMRGENFVAHLYGLGSTPVCRGTPVAHHCPSQYTIHTEQIGVMATL
jgi:hypothetical protein